MAKRAIFRARNVRKNKFCEELEDEDRIGNEFWMISSRLYRKAQGKACTQACRNRRRDQKSMDCGACIGQ